MPFFRYLAREKSGKLRDETLEAVSQEDLVNSLQSNNLYVISVGPAIDKKRVKKAKRRYHRNARTFDLILFARELSTLLGSGVTLIKSLEILCKQIESVALLRAVEQIRRDVEGGFTFQNALRKHPKIFNEFWVHLVETGEASGHLPLSLEQLSTYMEESAALKKKIVSAMIYPIILMCVAGAAIAVFLFKIIPVFIDIFKGFEVPLPLLTQIVVNLSGFVRRYFLLGAGTAIAAFFAVKKYVSTEVGREQFDAIKFKLPLIGPLMQEISTERFTSGLSTLLKSGVPILHALEIAEKIAGNKVMEAELKRIKVAVRDGKGMAHVMQEGGIFSPLVVQMINVGEEIGELDKMLSKISLFYKERVNTFITRLTTMFEPLVLVFMGIIVGILVVSMFMPIFGISTAVKMGG